MSELPLGAMEKFSTQGGILGLVIFVQVVLVLVILYGFYWYIKSSRRHELDVQEHNANQYQKRLEAEKSLIDAIHNLTLTIRKRPCMQSSVSRVEDSQGKTRLWEKEQ